MAVALFVPVLSAFLAATEAASLHSLSVTGKLLCGNRPTNSKETWVSLLNKNVGPDDQVYKACNDDGTFNLTLTVSYGVLSWFKPEFHIHTNCNDKLSIINVGDKPCQRKWKITVPRDYVDSPQPYNVGTFNLEGKQKDEERDCIIFWPKADVVGTGTFPPNPTTPGTTRKRA